MGLHHADARLRVRVPVPRSVAVPDQLPAVHPLDPLGHLPRLLHVARGEAGLEAASHDDTGSRVHTRVHGACAGG